MDYWGGGGGGWGGPKGMLAPPLKLLGGGLPPPPRSSYAYATYISSPNVKVDVPFIRIFLDGLALVDIWRLRERE